MWKLTGNPKTYRITKDLAHRFANMNAAPGDRPMSEVRLRVYEKLMRAGNFRPVSWAAAHCEEIGETLRVNGKHTATLCATLPLDELPPLYAVVEFYNCAQLDDVSKLYATYDSRMQSRTVADINRSFASCVMELETVDARTINTSLSGMWFCDKFEQYSAVQPAERAELLLEQWPFIVWAAQLIQGRSGQHRHLLRVAVLAAMYGSYRKSKKEATDFWLSVRDETDPTPKSPARQLSRFLLTHSANNAPGKQRHRVKDREFFVKSVRAWNGHRTGEPTALQYSPKQDIPAFK